MHCGRTRSPLRGVEAEGSAWVMLKALDIKDSRGGEHGAWDWRPWSLYPGILAARLCFGGGLFVEVGW